MPAGADEPTCHFRILNETLPAVFLLSGDNQSTMVDASIVDTSLAGTLLLAEYSGSYSRRCLIWLWQYVLIKHSSTPFWITAEGPDIRRGGRLFVISGCTPELRVHELALKGRLSGRVLIQEFTKQPRLFFLWEEIRRAMCETFKPNPTPKPYPPPPPLKPQPFPPSPPTPPPPYT